MELEATRGYCLSLPHATEKVQWEDHLLFCIADKMFCMADLNGGTRLSLKSTPEEAAELCEREGIIPAPYLARYHWVTLEDSSLLRPVEVKQLIAKSYNLVWAKLAKNKRPV